MGTPTFAVPILDSLIKNEYKPVLVVTQPDRPQKRSSKVVPPPVKVLAEQYGIPVLQPEKINDLYDSLAVLMPDIIITAAYGGFLGKKLLTLPHYGCVNIHPSLLPKYRGASPINAALLNGDSLTGVTIFRMNKQMDRGDILYQTELQIAEDDNHTSLSKKLANKAANDLLVLLDKLQNGEIKEKKQDDSNATYCCKIQKDDTQINWNSKGIDIVNHIRAFSYDIGAVTNFRDKKIKIMNARLLQDKSEYPAGRIVGVVKKEGIVVSTLDYNIILTELQPAGKKIMPAYDFHLGAKFEKGESFAG